MSLENGEKVSALVDKDYILRLATDLCDIYSPTGDEKAVADFIYNEFGRLGLQRKYQEIYPGRFNVVGQLEGTGGGPTLMLNGHMDISHTHRESEIPGRGILSSRKSFWSMSTNPANPGWSMTSGRPDPGS